MASNYPTSIDSFTDPISTSPLNSPSHAGQHQNINDAVEKLETKLGVGASPATGAVNGSVIMANGSGTTTWTTYGVGTWTAYTPTFTNMTLGNGTLDCSYSQLNKIVFVQFKWTLGSTSSISVSGGCRFTLPVTAASRATLTAVAGVGFLNDVGNFGYPAYVQLITTTTANLYYFLPASTGGPQRYQEIYRDGPFVWATGDVLAASFYYEAA